MAAESESRHAAEPPRRIIVFYDGTCGACHRGVKFLIARDRSHSFDYAPLQGTTYLEVPAALRESAPDSVLAWTSDGRLLARTRAVIECLSRLPGAWPLAARLLRVIPARIADAAYDAFARRRSAFATKPDTQCPLVPPELRGRFLP